MNTMRTAIALIATILSLAMAGAAMGEGATSLTVWLTGTLDAFRTRYGFPGETAAIVLPDGTVATAATGVAIIQGGTAMIPGSRILAASIGKTSVAAAVLALKCEGRLSRADLLADHLGDRAWFTKLPNTGTITIGHLLRHQSGLPDHPHLPSFQAAAAARIAAGKRAFTPDELLGFVADRAPRFAAGDGWAYSDTGYIVLGLVIEEVTGPSYYDVLREEFLDPLGLSDTIPSDRPALPGLAVGYTIPSTPFGLPVRTADAKGRLPRGAGVERTGGGLASTAKDLARWGHVLFGRKAIKSPYLDRLLVAVSVAPEAPGVRYGVGVGIHAEMRLGPVYGHGGWILGYVSSLRHHAAHAMNIAFQINSDVGVVDDSSDPVPELETEFARPVIGTPE